MRKSSAIGFLLFRDPEEVPGVKRFFRLRGGELIEEEIPFKPALMDPKGTPTPSLSEIEGPFCGRGQPAIF